MSDIVDSAQELELSADEARVLQGIVRREAVLRELAAAVSGLEALNRLAGAVIKGPVTLAIQWNKGLIQGWKSANGHLANIAAAQTCTDINLMYIDAAPSSQNYTFWSNLRSTMGC